MMKTADSAVDDDDDGGASDSMDATAAPVPLPPPFCLA
jgi:hypothetical protein